MLIYVSHSSSYDFQNDLYIPLRNSLIGKNNKFIFPHEQGVKTTNSKNAIKTADLLLVEASYSSTGSGIEVGWAEDTGIPIVCVHRDGTAISQSLKMLARAVISYKTSGELIEKLMKYLTQFAQ